MLSAFLLSHRIRALARSWLNLCAWLSCLAALFSPARLLAAEHYLVRSWQSDDGLPSNNVRAVVQAADGYLWVATAEGVVRFDGLRFSSFVDEGEAELARLPCRALFALPDGSVWVVTVAGTLLRWDGRHLKETEASIEEESQGGKGITHIVSDGGGGVLIDDTKKIFHVSDGMALRTVNRTAEVLAKIRSATPPFWQRCSAAPAGKPLELSDSRGRHWQRTDEGRLRVIDPTGLPETMLPQFPSDVRISALLEDREHHLWVATNGSGLFQVRERRVDISDAEGLSDVSIGPVLTDHTGALWIVSKDGVLHHITGNKVENFTLSHSERSRQVASICEDSQGVLWAVKETGTLFRFDGQAFQPENGEKPVMRRVRAMLGDIQGNLWLGGSDGLAIWEKGTLTTVGLRDEKAVALVADQEQQVWVACASGVLYHGAKEHMVKAADLGRVSVSTLLPDGKNNLWVSTLGAGLFLVQSGNVTRFAEAQGLPDPRLTCVLEEPSGYLWLASLAGIFRVSKAELLHWAQHPAGDKPSWISFDRADGMISRECTGGFQPSGCRDHDGCLWFPTVRGLASIQPANLQLNQVPPQVTIESARAGDAPPTPGYLPLESGPGRSRLEFRFTAPTFDAPEKAAFRIRLEGLDDEWQDLGPQRTAFYEAAPPGHYTLHVRASNNDGVWNTAEATLAVHVRPYFWQTLWFRITCIGAILLTAWAAGAAMARARLRRRMLLLEAQSARHRERERIAQDLHDDLGASLTEISLLAGLAAEESNPVKRSEALPSIATRAQELVSTLDEIVWAVNPRHDTLASLVEYISACAAELLEAKGIALRRELPERLPDYSLEAEARHALFLASREALNNCVKHSGAFEVKLAVQLQGDRLEIAIKDNGQGLLKEAPEFSEGLRNMRARMAGIGGECRIESNDHGTSVILILSLHKGVI